MLQAPGQEGRQLPEHIRGHALPIVAEEEWWLTGAVAEAQVNSSVGTDHFADEEENEAYADDHSSEAEY